MKTYTAIATSAAICEVDIKANSEEEAYRIAQNMDGSEFVEQSANWTIRIVEKGQKQLLEKISITWRVEDVQEVRPDLSREQAAEVLQEVERTHDACFGVNWDALECAADALFPELKPNTDA